MRVLAGLLGMLCLIMSSVIPTAARWDEGLMKMAYVAYERLDPSVRFGATEA